MSELVTDLLPPLLISQFAYWPHRFWYRKLTSTQSRV